MPQTVTPVAAPAASSVFPGNLSGIATPSREGAADFAELLKGSQNRNAASAWDGKTEAEPVTDAARDGAEIALVSAEANGDAGDGETDLTGDGEALLPLTVLTGEAGAEAADETGLPSTIAQLTPAQTVTKAVTQTESAPVPAAPTVAVEAATDTAATAPLKAQGVTADAATGSVRAGIAAGAATPAPATAPTGAETATDAAAIPAAPMASETAAAAAQGDSAKAALTAAQQAARPEGKQAIAAQQPTSDAADRPTPGALAELQQAQKPDQADMAAPAKELAKQLAPGQQAKLSVPHGERPADAPGAAVSTAARMANGSLAETGETGATMTGTPADADQQAVKAAVQAALADAGRGRMANGQGSQPGNGATQTPVVPEHVETGAQPATAATDPALDPVLDEAVSLDTTAVPEADLMLQTATTTAAAVSAAQQAEAQASASAPQSGVVTVQAGEMGETVATATPSTSNANAMARTLQMIDPEWPVNLSSMIRAAQEMGQSEIEIALQPEKLGKMTIKLDMRDGSNVAVNIVTETDAAARMLNDNQSRLAELMQKAGLDLTQHQASSGQGFQGQNGEGGQMGQNSGSGTEQWQNLPEDDIPAQSVQASPDKGIDIIA